MVPSVIRPSPHWFPLYVAACPTCRAGRPVSARQPDRACERGLPPAHRLCEVSGSPHLSRHTYQITPTGPLLAYCHPSAFLRSLVACKALLSKWWVQWPRTPTLAPDLDPLAPHPHPYPCRERVLGRNCRFLQGPGTRMGQVGLPAKGGQGCAQGRPQNPGIA